MDVWDCTFQIYCADIAMIAAVAIEPRFILVVFFSPHVLASPIAV